ncbi:alpha/beta hydrolase [Paraferrimonas sp. SM1919]|uniref:alpha/beta hydrolase n=1 Tax=Paraferrimonas sp. SM1919 TaxID=2662263 RepID=UPI0013D5E179|nr:acetylxylan esterase [Paraferrimonas sp. SM1919]
MWKKITLGLVLATSTLALLWYMLFGLKSYQLTEQQLKYTFEYQEVNSELDFASVSDHEYAFTFSSFDGAQVNGRIKLPMTSKKQSELPIFIGLHAMGRSDNRWFSDSFKDRPTLEQTHTLANMALEAGNIVIAMDARNHGLRKDPQLTIKQIMWGMHLWGKRQPYENMIINTVKDYRVLLDLLQQHPQFNADKVKIAGYSMGGHMALLLASADHRVTQVLSIVPPHLDDKTALVAPQNYLKNAAANKIWLVSANDDKYADIKDNQALFNLLKAGNKRHIQFEGGHVLPDGYPQQLHGWF